LNCAVDLEIGDVLFVVSLLGLELSLAKRTNTQERTDSSVRCELERDKKSKGSKKSKSTTNFQSRFFFSGDVSHFPCNPKIFQVISLATKNFPNEFICSKW
jgi:hypothetical protein